MKQEGDGTVTWVQKTAALPLSKEARNAGEVVEWERERVTTRYWVDWDGEGILIKMVVGSWLRIGKIKVEGSTFKPARAVVEGWGSK
jgi:methionyl-tRNA formyltransferase